MKAKSLFLFFFFCLTSFGAEYFNPERNFVLSYDDSIWEVVPPTKETSSADVDRAMSEKTLVTLQRKNADDKYRARFSVVADNLKKFQNKGKTDLEAYKEHAAQFLQGQRFHLLSTELVKAPVDGVQAYEIVANQRDFGLTFRQLVFIHEGEAYLLTAAARTKKFQEYLPELKKISESFKFKKGKTR